MASPRRRFCPPEEDADGAVRDGSEAGFLEDFDQSVRRGRLRSFGFNAESRGGFDGFVDR